MPKRKATNSSRYTRRTKYGRFAKRRNYLSQRPYSKRSKAVLGRDIVTAYHTYTTEIIAAVTDEKKALGLSFNANAFPGSSNLLQTFDDYRIMKIYCTLYNETPDARMTKGYIPTAYMCSDSNDQNAPSLNWISAKSSTKSKMLRGGDSMSLNFTPYISNRTGVSGQYTIAKHQWLSSSSGNEPHLALKVLINRMNHEDSCRMMLKAVAEIQYRGMGAAD